MAKMGEGEYYYYAPVPADANPLFYSPDTFEVWKRGDFSPMAANLKQDNASLIVDALNFYNKYKHREADIISNMQYDGEEVGTP